MIIDFHAHAFPDQIAATAVPALAKKGKVTPCLDGTIGSLLLSMDKAGIEKSVLCSIATKPGQFDSILSWSKSIRSDRIFPFPSFHPENPAALDNIDILYAEGFRGIKLHPYYQDFIVDEERMFLFYEKISERELILVMHTGYDIGFPRDDIAGPSRIKKIIEKFPDLKIIATHMGAWEMWDEVSDQLLGKNIYIDISFSLQYLERDKAREMILGHSADHILFGTDSPWACQNDVEVLLRELDLGNEIEEKIFYKNAVSLLGY